MGTPVNDQITVKIASGASQSAVIDTFGWRIAGIMMPAAWDAAALTFLGARTLDQGGVADTTFQSVTDQAGAEVSFAGAVAGKFIAISNTDILAGVRFIKLRSGNNATPVNQTADRFLYLVTIPEG